MNKDLYYAISCLAMVIYIASNAIRFKNFQRNQKELIDILKSITSYHNKRLSNIEESLKDVHIKN